MTDRFMPHAWLQCLLVTVLVMPFTSGMAAEAGKNRDRDAMQAEMKAILADPARTADASASGAERGAICAYCHGSDGISKKGWLPNLAGQSAEFILDQNLAYAVGDRVNNVMNDLAASMTDAELINLSVYYAVQAPERIEPELTGKDLTVGENFYKGTCTRCHGEDGRGKKGYTWIAGQKQEYVRRALARYRDREGGRMDEEMAEVTANITDQLIDNLAAYIATLH
ncbi:MAG: c-type cytochrome [Gammaproteobacteria bacterium]|nr:c-type cytochrome [Gammaproteobacteria bacterium]MCP5137500.1 c-type cytochrome [Gammaproteobacteria bacterium]